MAVTISKVNVWAGEMPDQPGALEAVLAALAEAGANLDCVIARKQPDKPGTGVVYVSPIKGRKMMDAARTVGLQPAEHVGTLRVECPNKPGQGQKILAAIAQAGINLRGVSAASMGTKSVAYLGFEGQADADAAAKALKKLK